jgi:hypothetical protein
MSPIVPPTTTIIDGTSKKAMGSAIAIITNVVDDTKPTTVAMSMRPNLLPKVR